MANFWTLYEYDSSLGTIKTTRAPLGRTTPVGSYVANAFGLYDMHGNVSEWCWNAHGTYPNSAVTDPVLTIRDSAYLEARGGSWQQGYGRYCRSASRNYGYPSSRYGNIGFRVALAPRQ